MWLGFRNLKHPIGKQAEGGGHPLWLPITNVDNFRDVAPSMGIVTQSTDIGRVADPPGPSPTVSPPFVDMLGKVAANLGDSGRPISRMVWAHSQCPPPLCPPTHAVPSPTHIPGDGGSELGQQLQELHLVRSPTALAAAAAASASSLAGADDQFQLCEEYIEA